MTPEDLLDWNVPLSFAHGIAHEMLVWLFMAFLGFGAFVTWLGGQLENA